MTKRLLTGIILILVLKRYRASGVLVAAGGTALAYAVYALWVP